LIKWLGGGLIVAALLVFGFGSAVTFRWIAIYGLFALATGVLACRGRIALRRADIALLALYLWVLLSVLWSSDYRTGIYDMINITALLGVYFLSREIMDIPLLVTASAVVALALIYIFPADNGGFGNVNFSTEFLLLTLPFIAWWADTRLKVVLGMLITAGILTVLYLNPSKIEYAVFGVGACALLLNIRSNRTKAFCGVVGGIAVFLVFAYTDMLSSILARSEIAMNTFFLWLESPVWGHGIGSFGIEYDRVREVHLGYISKWIMNGAASYPGAAHNEIMQLMAATGLIGLCLFVLFVRYLCQGRNNYAFAVLGAGLVLSVIEFPMQNPWSALLIVMAAGIVTKDTPVVFRMKTRFTLLPILVAVGMGYTAPKAIASAYYLGNFRALTAVDSYGAFKANLASYEAYPLLRYPRMQLAMSLAALSVDFKDRLVLSNEAADRVYEISTTAAKRMPAVLIARGQYLLNAVRYSEPEMETVLDDLKRYSPHMPVVWLLDAWVGVFKKDIPRIMASLSRVPKLDITDERHLRQMNKILSFIKPKEAQ